MLWAKRTGEAGLAWAVDASKTLAKTLPISWMGNSSSDGGLLGPRERRVRERARVGQASVCEVPDTLRSLVISLRALMQESIAHFVARMIRTTDTQCSVFITTFMCIHAGRWQCSSQFNR
eukprot:IDg17585t1